MAAWFATKGIGNLIVVIVAESTLITNQVSGLQSPEIHKDVQT